MAGTFVEGILPPHAAGALGLRFLPQDGQKLASTGWGLPQPGQKGPAPGETEGFGSSAFSVVSLKPRMALPSELPISGSRLAPKMSNSKTRMTRSSGIPRPNMGSLQHDAAPPTAAAPGLRALGPAPPPPGPLAPAPTTPQKTDRRSRLIGRPGPRPGAGRGPAPGPPRRPGR